MDTQEASLITLDEVQDLTEKDPPLAKKFHLPLIVIVGLGIIAVFVLVVMILVSLRGSRTGFETLLPFLDKEGPKALEIPK